MTDDHAENLMPVFVCPRCEASTSHPEDVRNRYCPRCHMFIPEPPENVRLVRRDGQTVPVDCRYDGWDDDTGVHVWTAVGPPGVKFAPGDAIDVDKLPGMTEIRCEMTAPPVDERIRPVRAKKYRRRRGR